MSAEWRSFSLAEIGRIVTGKTPQGGQPEFFNGRVPFVTPPDFAGQKWITETTRTVSEVGAQSVRGSVIPPRSVLVTCIGSDMGKASIASTRCLTNQQINAVVVDETRFSPEFLFYNLALRKAEIRGIAGGSAQPILNKSAFGAIRVSFPNLSEQRRIANLLGPLDDRIALLRETNSTLEAIAQALFKSWFVDFDPVRAKQQGLAPAGMDEATAALFPDSFEESVLGLVPSGWKARSMEEVSTVGIGKTPPRKEPQWFSERHSDVRWVSIRDMGVAGAFAFETSEYLTDEAIARFNVRIVPDHTTLLSFKMTIGRVAITDGEMTTNEAIAHFKLNEQSPVTTEFIYLTLKQFDFSTLSSTSSIADAVNSKTVRALPLVLPTAAVLRAFQDAIAPVFQRMKGVGKQAQTLATLRDTLLPRLISGQLRLPEAQAQIEVEG